jgi:peptide/nickel transport system substrate-binding protein
MLIIQTIMGGSGRLSEAIMSSNTDDQVLPEDEVRRLLARDVNAARGLLQQSGVTGWTPDIWVFAGQSQNLPAAELVQAQLREIGITTRLQQMDTAKLNSWFGAHDLPIGIAVVSTGSGPNSFLAQALKTGGSRNVANLSDPELDRLIDAQAAELRDRNRRRDMLHQIQRRTIDLAAHTPMFVPELFTAAAPQVRNLASASARVGEASYYEEVWLDQ